MDRSSPDPDPALAVGDDLKSAADHPIDPTPRADPPGGHPPNPADGSYTAHNTPPPLAFFIYDDIFAILKRTPLYFLESRFLHEY
jgi:hypothetical protein